jgi:2,5-diamino-6-(ribosylamino)-4(3H)-pyrimidinone 5'-phosphate reductase
MRRPYVVINVAASVDGKIDTVARQGASISSAADRARVDALRASVDAVMVGGHTLLDEDPRLTVKSAELRLQRLARGVPEHPAKVGIVSRPGLVRPDSRFLTAGPARVILFAPEAAASPVALGDQSHSGDSAPGADPPQAQDDIGLLEGDGVGALRATGVELFSFGAGRVDLRAALAKLSELGLGRVLVEGGGSLNFELFRLGLVDELQLYIAPLIFGGASAPTLADGAGLPRELARALKPPEVSQLPDGGVLLRYMVEPS